MAKTRGQGLRAGDLFISIGANVDASQIAQEVRRGVDIAKAAAKQAGAGAVVQGSADISAAVTQQEISARAQKMAETVARRQKSMVVEHEAMLLLQQQGVAVGPSRIQRAAEAAAAVQMARSQEALSAEINRAKRLSRAAFEIEEENRAGAEAMMESLAGHVVTRRQSGAIGTGLSHRALHAQAGRSLGFFAPGQPGYTAATALAGGIGGQGVRGVLSSAIAGTGLTPAGAAGAGAIAASAIFLTKAVTEGALARQMQDVSQRRLTESFSIAGLRGESSRFLRSAGSMIAESEAQKRFYDATVGSRMIDAMLGFSAKKAEEQRRFSLGAQAYQEVLRTGRSASIASAAMGGDIEEATRLEYAERSLEVAANYQRLKESGIPGWEARANKTVREFEEQRRRAVALSRREVGAQMLGIEGQTMLAGASRTASERRMTGDALGGFAVEQAAEMAALMIRQQQEAAQFLPGSRQAIALSRQHEAEQAAMQARQKEAARQFSTGLSFGQVGSGELLGVAAADALRLTRAAEGTTAEKEGLLVNMVSKIIDILQDKLRVQ